MDSDEGSRDQVADQLVNMIIRPPRAKYCIQQLGPPKFQLGNWFCSFLLFFFLFLFLVFVLFLFFGLAFFFGF